MTATIPPTIARFAHQIALTLKYQPTRKSAPSLVAAAPRGTKTAAADALYAISAKRAERASRNRPVPTVRQFARDSYARRLGRLMREHGPVPAKSGAGELAETVKLGSRREPESVTTTGSGDRSSVANSYGYAVIDHAVTHHLPADAVLKVVGGLVTLVRYRDRNARVAECWWAKRGRGYSCTWEHGYLIGDYHAKAKSLDAAKRRERAARRTAHVAYWDAKRRAAVQSMPLSARWLTWADSLAAGNCDAGTMRAAERLAPAVGLTVDDLRAGAAVRADVVSATLPDLAPFVGRALTASAH